MVSELAGEGAVPPQLPAPTSRSLEIAHHSVSLQQPIRRGYLVRRQRFDPQTPLSYSYSALRLSNQLSDYELDHIDEKNRNLSRVLFYSSHSWSRSMEILSRVLTNRLFTSFNRGSRSRSVEISSRVLIDPMFPVFDRSSQSKSVESTSTTLVMKKSKKNKPAGGSIARDLDECRRGLFDVILKLINDVSELFGDPERHQQSRRECAAVIETCAECAEIINTGNQYIFNTQSKYSSAESSDCKTIAKLFEEVFDKLNDMAVLLHLNKTGKAKAKEGDDVNVNVKGKERTTLISSGLLLCFTTHTVLIVVGLLFFEKHFLIKGNILTFLGVALTIGVKFSLQLFPKGQNFKGPVSFVIGLFLVGIGWPIIGMILECYGFVVIFSSWPSLFSLPEKVTCGWLDILATISGITGTINGKTITSYLIKSIQGLLEIVSAAKDFEQNCFCCENSESSITSLFNQNCFAAKVVYHVDSKFDEHDILYDVLRLDAEHTDFTWEDVLQFSVYLIVPVSLTSILS
nr:vesicle transport protein GOT1-like [Ipomoea batatas]